MKTLKCFVIKKSLTLALGSTLLFSISHAYGAVDVFPSGGNDSNKENDIGYALTIKQNIGDNDAFQVSTGLKTYEDPSTPIIINQGWTHTSSWLLYELKGSSPAKVTFKADGDPSDPKAVPALTLWSGGIVDHDGPMRFSEMHAYLPDPKIANPAPGFDPDSWPKDSADNYIFWPLYADTALLNLQGYLLAPDKQAWLDERRTDLNWLATEPNDPDNPSDSAILSMVLDPGIYTLNISNHFNPDGPGDTTPVIFDFSVSAATPAVPIPAAAWLFGSAMAGVFGWHRRFGKSSSKK